MLPLVAGDGIAASPPEPPQADPAPEPPAAFLILPHFNRLTDVMDWLLEAGVPAHLLCAHRIPAEAVSPDRLRSSASPTWTGFYQPAATVGITKFGMVDPDLMLRYAYSWGNFEWHRLPRGVGSISTPEYEARLRAAAAPIHLQAGFFHPLTLTHDRTTTPPLFWSSDTMPLVPVLLTPLHSRKP